MSDKTLAESATDRKVIDVEVNGTAWKGEIRVDVLLLDFLRDELGLTGAKRGCDSQVCGACTVLVDGEAKSSCTYLAFEVDGATLETVEGLSEGDLNPLQEAFVRNVAQQCGYCTSGQLMSCTAMLRDDPRPDDETIDRWLKGHLCRCGCYPAIRSSIHEVASSVSHE